jgi:hypothetical protein
MSPQELDSSQTVCQQKPQTFQSPELGLSSSPIYVGPASIPPSQPGNQLSFPQHVPLQSFPQDVCQNETQYPQQQDQNLFQGQQLQLDVTHMTTSEGQWRNHSSFPRAQPLEDITHRMARPATPNGPRELQSHYSYQEPPYRDKGPDHQAPASTERLESLYRYKNRR